MSGNVPTKLPFDQFLKTFEFVPRMAVNLLVVRTDEAILLTRRKKPPFAGSWHLPGSFLLKGESLMECVHRVAKEEIGMDVTGIELAGAFDDLAGDPRGHVVDMVYRCRIEKGLALRSKARSFKAIGDTAEMRFFTPLQPKGTYRGTSKATPKERVVTGFKKLPKNIGFNHSDTLRALGYR